MGATHSQEGTTTFFKMVNPKEASTYLNTAEQQDHYIEEVEHSRTNAYARQEMSYLPNKLSPKDTEALEERINSFLPMIPPKLKDEGIHPIIISLMPSADGGMPHTRSPNLICLPFSAHSLTIDTFVHEMWHIHQRKFWSVWIRFYEEAWFFKPFDVSDLPERLEEVLRINPDTVYQPLFIWKKEWVPMCVFLNPMSPSFKETAVWFYNVRTRIHYKNIPNEMATFFSRDLPLTAYEHPNELAAYMLGNRSPQSSNAYEILIRHLGERAKIIHF